HLLKAGISRTSGGYFLVRRAGLLRFSRTGIAGGDAVVGRLVFLGGLRIGVTLAFARIAFLHGILFVVLGSFALVFGFPLLAILLIGFVVGFCLGGVLAFVVRVLLGIARFFVALVRALALLHRRLLVLGNLSLLSLPFFL